MRSAVPPLVTVILFASFVYAGHNAGWWQSVYVWDWHTRAIFFLGALLAWIMRNEFGGHS